MKETVIDQTQLEQGFLHTWLCDRYTTLELELGCGLGDFICEIARYNEHKRFIGVDINQESCEEAAYKVRTQRLSNVSIVNYEAYAFMSQYVQSNSLAAIHIYFPTPDPPRPGAFKRLVSHKLAEEVYRALRGGGILRVVTDLQEYFSYISKCFSDPRWWHTAWASPVPNVQHEGLLLNTGCERKYGREGEVFSIQAVK